METPMKKLSDFLAKAAYCLAAIFLLYLVTNAIHYSFHFDLTDFYSNAVYEGPQSRLRSIILLFVFSAVYYILYRIIFFKADNDAAKKKRLLILSIVLSSIAFAALVAWITFAKILPWYDQETVLLTAQNFNAKDYFAEPTYWLYLKQYPQEFGLVFIEALLLRIWNSYLFLEYINALLIALIIYLACRFCMEITGNVFCSYIALVATFSCLPMYYYVVYIYGDIFSIFGCLFVSLMSVRWLKSSKKRYLVYSILMACIMVPARKNNLIFLIALAIVLIVFSVKNKKLLPVPIGVAMIVLPLLCLKGTQVYYETLADYKIDNSIPAINWVVMGLRGDLEDGEGVGFFDGYVYWNWNILGQDKKATQELAKKDLKEFLDSYKKDPRYAYRYFRYKALEQWDEPTFASIYMTAATIDSNYEKMSVLYRPEVTVMMQSFMAYFQVFVYTFSFLFFVYAFFRDEDFYSLIIAVTFIGGFIFSLLWEASGRYVFPYFVFLIPAAAMGFWKSCRATKKIVLKMKGRTDGKSDKKLNCNT